MSFTASFTAYQRVGASRRASEHSGPADRRPADPPGDGVEVVTDATGPGGPAVV